MKKEITVREWNELISTVSGIRNDLSSLLGESDKDLLTPDEVCSLRRFSKSKYKRLVAKGVISQIRYGPAKNSRVYVQRSEFERLVEEGKI